MQGLVKRPSRSPKYLIKLIIRAVAGQRSSPALCFATKSIKSMTKDIDLNVTQLGRDTSDQYLPTC